MVLLKKMLLIQHKLNPIKRNHGNHHLRTFSSGVKVHHTQRKNKEFRQIKLLYDLFWKKLFSRNFC